MTSPTTDTLWTMTHGARADLVADLSVLSDDQWRETSLCPQWDVEHVVAHLTAAASVGRVRWIRSIVAAGFRPAVHNDRRLREHLGASPVETLARFEEVVGSTIAPTGDIAAFLGEVLVHGQDIRVPLGIDHEPDLLALTAVAEFFSSRDFAVPSRSTVRGLALRATDGDFESGAGAVVTGPTLALVMTMSGRTAYLDRLDGPGVAILRERLDAGPQI
ncbi:maleylpyruvate isomerase family mycothiol-dependent enzyme [Ornithinimicrobium cryptoxanthini]|uniref:maleylpyruvate isomerase family mycothiol-dependent enzyme n=1 Tax=Ornithinimicrobium cryptoxanthini TaxID=2934161 RepID=UPI002119A8C9|nr:maleylpyruvate isomerase family mycothiol-dependent enzyme [Ornithinimicrobium cryptoxanthini]